MSPHRRAGGMSPLILQLLQSLASQRLVILTELPA